MAQAGILLDKKLLAGLLILPKPGIVALVLVSGTTGLYLGGHGSMDAPLAFWTLLGLALSTAGAASLNNYLDRDIDSIMSRTKGRTLPSGSLNANMAYVIGTALVAIALALLKIAVGTLVCVLTGAAVFIYVVLYTLFLKRLTPAATHIGGIAGAMPPLIGYAAAHHSLDIHAVILFLIIVVWQQPHFWSLALKYREEYAKAKVPIHPVALGIVPTKLRILIYVVMHFPIMVLPYLHGMAGARYLWVAMLLTVVYLAITMKFVFSEDDREMTVFHFSNIYLMIVFGMMMVDAVK